MPTATTSFLLGVQFRPLILSAPSGYSVRGFAVGQGNSALELVAVTTATQPRAEDLHQIWRVRHAGFATPVVVTAAYGGKVAICGPMGSPPPVYFDLDAGQAERILLAALAAPDGHVALRMLQDVLPKAISNLPGLRNEGLLATGAFWTTVKSDIAYPVATAKARTIVGRQDRDLLEALGYHLEHIDKGTLILHGSEQKRLGLAVLLQQHESPDMPSERFSNLTPPSYALSVSDHENVPFVFVCQGPNIRLYPVRVGVSVGQCSRAETFIEAHTTVLRDEDLGHLWMLFSADALGQNGIFEHLLAVTSRQFLYQLL